MADNVITCGMCRSQSWVILSNSNKIKCAGCNSEKIFYFNRKDKKILFAGRAQVLNHKLSTSNINKINGSE